MSYSYIIYAYLFTLTKSFMIQEYESMALRKKEKLQSVVRKGIEKFPQNVRLNLLKEEMCGEVRGDGGENMVVSLQGNEPQLSPYWFTSTMQNIINDCPFVRNSQCEFNLI